MQTALLLVDIQNDYFPGGSMSLVNSVEAGKNAGILLEKFRSKKLPVIHMQHMSVRPGATFFVPGTKGVEIHDCVKPAETETLFTKKFPNSFRDTGLLQHLQDNQITKLVIAGMMTHMCIDSTTRAAFDLGFSCTLAHDACATKDLVFSGKTIEAAQVHHSFIAALNGLFAGASSVEEICASL